MIKQSGMRLGLRMTISAAAVALLCGSASAQTTTPTDTTTTPDINQLLQQFGGLFGFGGTGTSGITTTPSTTDTTTGTTDTTPGTDPGTGTGPQPTIIGNQFTTTTGGALSARRPGLMIQHSFAVQNGTEMIPGDYEDTPSFARATVDEIALNFLDTITGLIESLNLLGSVGDIFNPGGSPGGGGGFTGAATTGGGTTTPIS